MSHSDDAPTDHEHSRGSKEARIVLIQYADFQCPYSAAAAPVMQETLEAYKEHVRLVYRHFPLTHIHPGAYLLSQISEAASKQGRFWEVHDFIYQNQSSLHGDLFKQFFEQIGVDEDQLQHDINSEAIKSKIDDDIRKANRDGVKKTPSFVLNGELFQNEWHQSGFRDQIANLLS